MHDHRSLATLSDDELLQRVVDVARRSRHTEAEIVAHIAEVDARRLYLKEACPSMFAYGTTVLHFSEAEAFLRITAARASREHPALLAMLADGRLHLSAVARLSPHLTAANRDAVLARAVHKSKREIEELIAELAPRPDVPASIRKLPTSRPRSAFASLPQAGEDGPGDGRSTLPPSADRGREPGVPPCELTTRDVHHGRHAACGAGQGATAAVTQPMFARSTDAQSKGAQSRDRDRQLVPERVDPSAGRPHAAARPATIEPTAPGRYKVQFTAGAALREKLARLQDLMRGSPAGDDLAAVIEAAVTEQLARLEARRFGKRRRSDTDAARNGRAAPAEPPAMRSGTETVRAGSRTSAGPEAQVARRPAVSRHIPAAVRRAVYERDGGRCSYRDEKGRRCGSRTHLEYHHRRPHSFGEGHTPTSLSLLCGGHHRLMTEADFGPQSRRASAAATGDETRAG